MEGRRGDEREERGRWKEGEMERTSERWRGGEGEGT